MEVQRRVEQQRKIIKREKEVKSEEIAEIVKARWRDGSYWQKRDVNMWICLLLTEQDSGGHVIKQDRENEEKLLCISPFYEYPHLSTDVFVPLKIKIQTMC